MNLAEAEKGRTNLLSTLAQRMDESRSYPWERVVVVGSELYICTYSVFKPSN